MEETQITESFSTSGSGNILQHYPVMPISLFYSDGLYTPESNLHISGNSQYADRSDCGSKNETVFPSCCEENIQDIRLTYSEQNAKCSATKNTENFKRFSVDNILEIADLSSGKKLTGKGCTRESYPIKKINTIINLFSNLFCRKPPAAFIFKGKRILEIRAGGNTD